MKGKNPRPHTVTLCTRAAAIVQERWPTEPEARVFPLSNMAMAAALDELGRGQYTVHGFRSTFKDWASDETEFQNEIIELALAHTVGNKVEQAYRRGAGLKKRFALMDVWERYCDLAKGHPCGEGGMTHTTCENGPIDR